MKNKFETVVVFLLLLSSPCFAFGKPSPFIPRIIQEKSSEQTKPSLLEADTHKGVVITTMDSGGYTYIEFMENDQKIWAAAPTFKVSVGDKIEFSGALPMQNFYSRTLEKTFDTIYFVFAVKVGDALPSEAGDIVLPEGHIPVGETSPPKVNVDPGTIKKAEGGYTVEECFSKKKSLNGKTVKIRGRVVKFNEKILGRNWIHIQDGTGTEGSNDLTVTTVKRAKVGELILITGVLAVDKDFSAGYSYPIIIEEAEITIEKNRK